MIQVSRILLLVAIATLPLIGIPLIGGSSEAREGQVIAVMADSGEFILPLRNGVIPSKPPLFHWIGYGFASLTGSVDEYSVRLPSLFAGLALLAVVVFVIRTVERWDRGPRENAIPEFAVVILSISYGYFHMMHQAMVDMVYALTVWLTIWAGIGVFDPEIDSRSRGLRRSIFWLCCAAAALARGPLGSVLPIILTAAAGITLRGNLSSVWHLTRPSLGWLIFAAVAFPWYFLAIDRGGMPFIERQLLFENLSRVTGGDFVNEESWYYYGPSLLRTTFPWSAIFIGLVVWRIRRGRPWRMSVRVPIVVVGVGMLCLSCSSGKRHSYLLPLYPCVAWGCAALMSEWCSSLSDVGRRRMRSTVDGVWVTLLVLSAVSIVGLAAVSTIRTVVTPSLWEVQSWVGSHTFRPVIVLSAIGALSFLLYSRARGVLANRLIASWVAVLGLLSTWHSIASGVKGHLKNFSPIAQVVSAKVPIGSTLSVLKHDRDEFFDPFFFYYRRPVRLLADDLTVTPSCVGYSLAKASWFDGGGKDALEKRGAAVTELGRFRNLVDGERERSDREMVLFLCQGGEDSDESPWV